MQDNKSNYKQYEEISRKRAVIRIVITEFVQ